MIICYSGAGNGKEKKSHPEIVLKDKANIMLTFATYSRTGKPDGRFQAILDARRSNDRKTPLTPNEEQQMVRQPTNGKSTDEGQRQTMDGETAEQRSLRRLYDREKGFGLISFEKWLDQRKKKNKRQQKTRKA